MRLAILPQPKARAKRAIIGCLIGALVGGIVGIALSTGTGPGSELPRWNGWSYALFCARLVAIPGAIVGTLLGMFQHRETDT